MHFYKRHRVLARQRFSTCARSPHRHCPSTPLENRISCAQKVIRFRSNDFNGEKSSDEMDHCPPASGVYSAQMRLRLMELLIQSTQVLEVAPIVKYTALSLYADRFYPSLSRFAQDDDTANWLLQPMRESNLQLFALISIWVSSKIHDSRPLIVKSLKSLGNKTIKDQHFTTRDFLEAVLNFEIGTANNAFIFFEELYISFKGVAKVGELLNFEACMHIMDLLYEKETLIRYSSPHSLAASILVASYVITVPKQRCEFPVLPWVKFITSCEEEDIIEMVKEILKHVFQPTSLSHREFDFYQKARPNGFHY